MIGLYGVVFLNHPAIAEGEVGMVEAREILRRWRVGAGLRAIAPARCAWIAKRWGSTSGWRWRSACSARGRR